MAGRRIRHLTTGWLPSPTSDRLPWKACASIAAGLLAHIHSGTVAAQSPQTPTIPQGIRLTVPESSSPPGPVGNFPAGTTAVPIATLKLRSNSSSVMPPSTHVVPYELPAKEGAGVLPAMQQTPMSPLTVPQSDGTGPLKNPLLSQAPRGLGRTPVTSPEAQKKLDQFVEKFLDPESTLDLITGQTRVLRLKSEPFRVQVADNTVVELGTTNPREVLLQGKKVGATVLNFWFGDKDDPNNQQTLTYLVRVFPDPEAKERLEKAYAALAKEINEYFQDCRVELKIVGDKLVVSGRVRDYVQGGQILQILRANMQAGGEVGTLPLIPPGDANGNPATLPPTAESFAAAGGPNVINLLEVAGEQQVLLRVLVAEVNRAAARSIGLNFSVTNDQGITVFANNTGPVFGGLGGRGLGGGVGGGLGFGGFGGFGFAGAIANVSATFDAGRIPFAINALKNLQYARSLAEPNLVAMNGVTANFLAGGQFPVPVIGGFGGFAGGLQGVSYVPFGVQLSFTPFITDRDRIRLVLNASISSRDLNTATNIGGGAVAGLTSRTVNTTVELRQGETLAVAGLIQYNLGADATRLPFLGDIPGLNVLTGLHRIQAGETELVIFITPELVRPLDHTQTVRLPGSEILDPTDLEFYILGRMEGHCSDYRSPIRTDLSRIRMYQLIEQTNIFGPAGYSPQQYPEASR